MGCGPRRVRFDPSKLTEIKEAITKFDIVRLVKKDIIYKIQSKGISRIRAKKTATQKRKGRRSGYGSRKGSAAARLNPKTKWVTGVRTQRELIKKLRDRKLIDRRDFRKLYVRVKGGFFRSTKHIKIHIQEQGMVKKK